MSEPLELTAGLILAAFSALGYGRLATRPLKIEGTLAADGVIGTTILTTGARQRCEVFTTLGPEDIDTDRSTASSPRLSF